MKPKRIILIRHGESIGNINKKIYSETPDYKLNLTERGKEQAKQAGEELKNIIKDESVFFYVSPFWRTRETFQNIKKELTGNAIQYREEPRIREQEWGHLRTPSETELIELARQKYGTFYFRFPNGESGADVYDRVSDFFNTLHRDFEKENYPQNCVVITHGLTLRLFLMRWFHWTVEEFEKLKNPENCAIIVLEKQENNKYKLIMDLEKYND